MTIIHIGELQFKVFGALVEIDVLPRMFCRRSLHLTLNDVEDKVVIFDTYSGVVYRGTIFQFWQRTSYLRW